MEISLFVLLGKAWANMVKTALHFVPDSPLTCCNEGACSLGAFLGEGALLSGMIQN